MNKIKSMNTSELLTLHEKISKEIIQFKKITLNPAQEDVLLQLAWINGTIIQEINKRKPASN